MAAVIGAAVPNYQGMFLRGHGSQNHVKNNGSAVGNTTTSHTSGNLGIVQGDAIRNMHGTTSDFLTIWHGRRSKGNWGNGAFRFDWNFYLNTMIENGNMESDSNVVFTFDASRITPTDSEIRPVNVAVKYIMFAGD